jgi:hypothetical protein
LNALLRKNQGDKNKIKGFKRTPHGPFSENITDGGYFGGD